MHMTKQLSNAGLCGVFLFMVTSCTEDIEVGSKEWCDFKKEMRQSMGEDNPLWQEDAEDFAKYCLTK